MLFNMYKIFQMRYKIFTKNLKCLKDPTYQTYQVKAHKALLSASSPVFETILKQNDLPKPLIFMRRVNSRLLNLLMDFVYFGQVEVDASKINEFLAIAEDLKIKGLTNTRQTGNLDPIQKSSKLDYLDEDGSDFGSENIIAQEIKAEEPATFPARKDLMEKIYPCKICGKRSKSESGLERHMYRNHSWRKDKTDQFANETLAGFNLGKKSARFSCNLCGRLSISKGGLEKHMSRHHPNKNELIPEAFL